LLGIDDRSLNEFSFLFARDLSRKAREMTRVTLSLSLSLS
jgi:hypothetical protein